MTAIDFVNANTAPFPRSRHSYGAVEVVLLLLLGMLVPVFLQTKFQLLKTGLKPVFSFTGLHRNLNFKPS